MVERDARLRSPEALKTVGGMIEQLRAQAEEDRDIANHLPVLELAGERLARALSEGADAFSDLEEIERRIEVWVEEETLEAFYGHLNDDPGLLEEPAMLCLWTMNFLLRRPARKLRISVTRRRL